MIHTKNLSKPIPINNNKSHQTRPTRGNFLNLINSVYSSVGKESACNAGDLGLIFELGGPPGEGKGYPFQYSGWQNSKDCVHGCQEAFNKRLPLCCFGSVRNPLWPLLIPEYSGIKRRGTPFPGLRNPGFSHYSDKYPLPSYEKVIVCNSFFDRDHLMFCKPGILIFIFAENNYSMYAHTMLIKTPLLHQSFGPPVFFFLSFSLSIYFRRIPWNARPAELTFLPRLLRPSREGTLCLHPLERAPGAYVQQHKP